MGLEMAVSRVLRGYNFGSPTTMLPKNKSQALMYMLSSGGRTRGSPGPASLANQWGASSIIPCFRE